MSNDDIFTKIFWRSTIKKVINTFGQSAAAHIVVVGGATLSTAGLSDFNWGIVASVGAVSAILCLLQHLVLGTSDPSDTEKVKVAILEDERITLEALISELEKELKEKETKTTKTVPSILPTLPDYTPIEKVDNHV